MPVLLATVVLVGALCVLDLLVTLGVIRRLREHTTLLSRLSSTAGTTLSLPVGAPVGPFATSTSDGEPVSTDLVREKTLVAFFSPSCQPCRAKVPEFVRYARAMHSRSQVLAVVVGPLEEARAFAAGLTGVARVVLDDVHGAVIEAFQVKAYPTVIVVEPDREGKLVVTADHVDMALAGAA